MAEDLEQIEKEQNDLVEIEILKKIGSLEEPKVSIVFEGFDISTEHASKILLSLSDRLLIKPKSTPTTHVLNTSPNYLVPLTEFGKKILEIIENKTITNWGSTNIYE